VRVDPQKDAESASNPYIQPLEFAGAASLGAKQAGAAYPERRDRFQLDM
jgi:hypothetical protein